MKSIKTQIGTKRKYGFKNKHLGFKYSKFGFKKTLTRLQEEWSNAFNRQIALLFEIEEESYIGELNCLEKKINALDKKLGKFPQIEE